MFSLARVRDPRSNPNPEIPTIVSPRKITIINRFMISVGKKTAPRINIRAINGKDSINNDNEKPNSIIISLEGDKKVLSIVPQYFSVLNLYSNSMKPFLKKVENNTPNNNQVMKLALETEVKLTEPALTTNKLKNMTT